MKAKCPHCSTIIEYLEYQSTISEWGHAYLDEYSLEVIDWDAHNSETHDAETSCPECGYHLDEEDIIHVEDDDDDDETVEIASLIDGKIKKSSTKPFEDPILETEIKSISIGIKNSRLLIQPLFCERCHELISTETQIGHVCRV